MSHRYKKVPYVTMGDWASTDHRFILVHENLSTDIVSIYDDTGECLFSFDEWGNEDEKDLGEAIIYALTTFNEEDYITGYEFNQIIKK
jgi:hypothetical protein